MSFTHLHLHTSYSLLDGSGRISEMVDRVKELGQDSMAITDHGAMYGAIDFFKSCVKKGIKPIIGSEIYVVEGSRLERKPDEERYHLILLCENDIGYKNLIKIVSSGFSEGFYYRPRVDYEILTKYHEGLICLSACIAGEVPRNLLRGDYEKAKLKAEFYKSIFGKNNYFIEIQNHGIPDEIRIHPDLIRLSKEVGVPLVATNDVHYTLKEDSFAHDCLICLQTGKKLSDVERMKYEKEKYYITSEDEMRELFKFCPEAVDNTKIIADRCNISLSFTKSAYKDLTSKVSDAKLKESIKLCEYHVPKFVVPEGFTNETYLKKLVDDGLKFRYGDKLNDELKNRAKYELDMIIKMGFADYFLIVWDYINYAKTHDIPVGPGRGSAVGSIVSFALRITDVDPIRFNLFFERFLNPERVSMPDIDTDFCIYGRDDVINYVKERYGKENVAQIATFGTLAAKQVLKDVGRVQDVPLSKTQDIANLIAVRPMLDKDKSRPDLTKMLTADVDLFITAERDNVEKFRELYNEDPEARRMIDTSLRLEGIPRQASVHASGVLIAPEDISNFVPFARGKEDAGSSNGGDSTVLVTEYDMKTLEELGLLKMDFLGLRNITAIKDCIDLVEKNHGIKIDINTIPYDDKDVFEMISDGDTLGIFQLESPGMTGFMQKLKPTVLEDLIAGISLFRPGPMDFIPKYVEGKHNAKSITYETEKLKKILEPTYGCIVYQEQVMQIVQELAGYTLGRADQVRRLMSKKNPELLNKDRENFIYGNKELGITGCVNNGVSESVASHIFDELAKFAQYAFNKSHAAAYATVAYETAYLKLHYKPEFFTSVCNSVMFKRDKLAEYVGNVILSGVKILPVDINKSYDNFVVEGDDIRMGFASLKKVGASISEEIISERNENGEYKSFKDAIKRISSRGGNKNSFEALIMCGAFDSFPGNRNQKMHMFPRIVEVSLNQKKNTIVGQTSIFDLLNESEGKEPNYEEDDKNLLMEFSDVKDFTNEQKLITEKEYTGIYLSGHPLSEFVDGINKYVNTKSTDLYADEDGATKITEGKKIRIAGIIDEITKLRTKRTGEEMVVMELSDMQGSFKAILFPKKYLEYKNLAEKNKIVFIEGSYNFSEREERGEIYIDKFWDFREALNSVKK